MDKQWSLLGSSGKRYTFDVFGKSTSLPRSGGIFIPVYAHPRGHLAGFEVHPLLMMETDDLRLAFSGVQQHDCLLRECWNYTLTLALDDPGQRIHILEDLALMNMPCR